MGNIDDLKESAAQLGEMNRELPDHAQSEHRHGIGKTDLPPAHAAQADAQLTDRRQRDLVVLRCHGTALDAQASRFRLASRSPDQACLSQAGAPGQEGGVSPAGIGLGDQLIDMLE